ncbi:MAG: YggT family protein [Candidatus Cloacimonetes bacterium]|nr:YggT family protein [Candidatus Cloacimonadota bacterium]
MFALKNLLLTFIKLLYTIANIFEVILIIRAVMSWFIPSHDNRIFLILVRITEPVLYRIRRFLPAMSIDFSPLIAILIVDFIIKGFILRTLAEMIIRL